MILGRRWVLVSSGRGCRVAGMGSACKCFFFHCFTAQSWREVWFGERASGAGERGDSMVKLKLITIIELIEEIIMLLWLIW